LKKHFFGNSLQIHIAHKTVKRIVLLIYLFDPNHKGTTVETIYGQSRRQII